MRREGAKGETEQESGSLPSFFPYVFTQLPTFNTGISAHARVRGCFNKGMVFTRLHSQGECDGKRPESGDEWGRVVAERRRDARSRCER